MEHTKRYDITVEEAARRCGVTTETIRRWARSGVLPGKRLVNRQWVFNADDLAVLPVRTVTDS